MADNAFVKIGTALLKHQVKKLVGEEALGAIGEELSEIGGDKLDAWLGEKSTIEELKKVGETAERCFHDSVGDHELEQWMVSLPISDLPKVLEAVEKLPISPDERDLEEAIRDAVAGWRKLSPEQTEKAVNSFLTCLRSALLPIEKQTLMVIGRSVLRTEDKVDLLLRWFEQYIITGKPTEVKQLTPEPVETWNLKHPYAMPPNFTGRVEERKMFADWLNKDNENRLFILRALGGFGKSALSWHWLTHDVDSKEWKKVLWWSFYEGDASFEHFIEETLKYLKLEVPQGGRPQVDELLKAMQGQKILLIMDGFERALRAYSSMNAAYQGDEEPKLEDNQLDCVNINAEIFLKSVCSLPNMKGKVLMTTRLTPRAVKPRGEIMLGCREEKLEAMQKEDAVEFFHKQKIRGIRAEIEVACAPYGYHPLSLRILAGLIVNDRENPGDIKVAGKLDITNDIIQNKHHVLKVSYDTLSFGQQKLLSNMACFRSSISYQSLKVIASKPSWKRKSKPHLNEKLDDSLQILESRGLLNWDRHINKYDLHPIVRRYAYERLPILDRVAAHTRLCDYFAAANVPEQVQNIEDLAPMIELYHHTVQTGKLDKACSLLYNRLMKPIYYQLGAYQTAIELLVRLFPDGDDKPPHLEQVFDQAWSASTLSSAYSLSGQPIHSVKVGTLALNLVEKERDKINIPITLVNLGWRQLAIGALAESEQNHRRAMKVCQEIEEKNSEGTCHYGLGGTLSYMGKWDDANYELNIGEQIKKEFQHIQAQGVISAYRAFRALLMNRDPIQLKSSNKKETIILAQRALELAQAVAHLQFPSERDFVVADWLLGAAYRLDSQFDFAERYLNEALTRCRTINLVSEESNILLDLARLRYDQEKYEEAKSLAEEALTITERCGYVLQGADVNLFLAQYALEQEKDKAKAKQYAETALKLATCDGPPYYYKVAYDEAERMLKALG